MENATKLLMSDNYDALVRSREEHKLLLIRAILPKHKKMVEDKLKVIRERIKEHIKSSNRKYSKI